MLETRSRLGEELTRRLTRWRKSAVPIVQAALAAGLSWLVAVHIVDHRAPFFAPVAAELVNANHQTLDQGVVNLSSKETGSCAA